MARIEGGAVHDAVAVPVPGVKGPDFTAALAGMRDGLSAGVTMGAAAVAGLRLKF